MPELQPQEARRLYLLAEELLRSSTTAAREFARSEAVAPGPAESVGRRVVANAAWTMRDRAWAMRDVAWRLCDSAFQKAGSQEAPGLRREVEPQEARPEPLPAAQLAVLKGRIPAPGGGSGGDR